jgi:hypothetical protein
MHALETLSRKIEFENLKELEKLKGLSERWMIGVGYVYSKSLLRLSQLASQKPQWD